MADGALYKIQLDVNDVKRQAKEVSDAIHGISKTAEQEGSKIDGVFKKIGAAAAGYFTVQQALAFAQSIVKVRSEIESLEVSFRTLLGSEAKASQLFGQIREFAVNTPMMMNDLSKGAQTLLAFNYDADKIMPTLKALGDISMGDSARFNSLALAFAQMSSAGKLMGQDLMQMINAGFNPLAEISAKTGKSISQLKDEMSKGAISAQMIEEAFLSAASEGGKFYGMLEAQSKTMAGSISNLQGAWEDMLNAIGQDAQGVFSDVVSQLTNIIKHYEEFGKIIADVIAVWGTYKTAVLLAAAAEKIRYQATLAQMAGMTKMEALTTVLTEKTAILNKTIFKNPYAIAAAAAVALGIAMYKLISNAGKLSKSMQAVEDTTANLNKEIAKEQLTIDSLFIKLKGAKEGTDDYNKAKQNILDHYGQYLQGLSDEISSLKDIEGAYKAITKAAIDSAKARAAASARENVFDIAAQSSGDVRVKLQKMVQETYGGKKTDKGRDAATYVWSELEKVLNNGDYDQIFSGNLSRILANVRKNNINIFGVDKFVNLINELKRIDAETQSALKQIDVRFGKPLEEAQQTQEGTNSTILAEDELKRLWEKQSDYEQRIKRIEEYKQKIKNAERDAELEIAQAGIDAMEEGLAKTLAQNELNYQKALNDNADKEAAMLEEYRDRMQTEWENANPDFKEKNKHFNRASITELPEEEKAVLAKYSELAAMQFNSANSAALSQALQEYETYLQKRTRIAEQYEQRRAALYGSDGKLLAGVSEGNIEEVQRQRNEALSAVDEEYAARSSEYQAWCNQISQLSLRQLSTLLREAQTMLQELEQDSTTDPQQLAVARAEVKKLSDEIRNMKSTQFPQQKNVEEWKKYNDVVTESAKVIRTLSSSFDDTTKEILESVADIAEVTYSIIGNIVKLVDESTNAVKGTTLAAVSAMTTMERASVILSIISAALQVAQLLAKIADPDKYAEEVIGNYQDKYDQIEWDLQNRQARLIQAYRKQLYLDSNGLLEEFTGNAEIAGDTLLEILDQTVNKLAFSNIGDKMSMGIFEYENKLKRLLRTEETFKELTTVVSDELAKLSYTADKAYGEQRYSDVKYQIQQISNQITTLYLSIQEEENKKNSDEDKINSWKQEIAAKEQEYLEYVTTIVDDIMGSSADGIAERLGNAFIDAFAAGEDAAKAWADEVNILIADIMKRMLIQKFVEERIGSIFDKYQQSWFADGNLVIDEVLSSMESLRDDLTQVGSDFSTIFDALPEDVKSMLNGSADFAATTGKGITTASQESVDELNGRVTAIQGHTYTISENSKVLLNNTTYILQSVRSIESLAADIRQKVSSIEVETSDMKRAINDFEIHGINIR